MTFGLDPRTGAPLRAEGWSLVREATPPAIVHATYTIENPTDQEIAVDFGFPILRGIATSPYSMMATPDVLVVLGDKGDVKPTIISNSLIYGIIRQRARETIDKGIAADTELATLAAAVKAAPADKQAAAGKALADYLVAKKWRPQDAALLVEYASLDLGVPDYEHPGQFLNPNPLDRAASSRRFDNESRKLMDGNLGLLANIGEQKATQFLAQLANCFDPKAGGTYEAIFTAWGGDVKEQSVDLKTGKVRPREISVAPTEFDPYASGDPAVYARVDYLDKNPKLSDADKARLRNILKNLPVVFTFAPMNLLHYQVKFPAKTTLPLSISYRQYAYSDTAAPASFQLAYVVHPASLWKEFGDINLEVRVPKGMPLAASVECAKVEEKAEAPAVQQQAAAKQPAAPVPAMDVYRGTLKDKTGEIFLAIEAEAWKKLVAAPAKPAVAPPTAGK